jgi:hypothetical protein
MATKLVCMIVWMNGIRLLYYYFCLDALFRRRTFQVALKLLRFVTIYYVQCIQNMDDSQF